MWSSRLLDISEDIPEEKIEKLLECLERKKLTPLEFTILEIIFNKRKVTLEDLLLYLNQDFSNLSKVGLFKSKNIKPILSRLKKHFHFVNKTKEKSGLGPLLNFYSLTDAGKEILKSKVTNNFKEQVDFMKNFLFELAFVLIQTVPEEMQPEKLIEVQNLLAEAFDYIKGRLGGKIN